MAAAASLVTISWEDRHKNSAVFKFHVSDIIIDPDNPLIQAVVAAINSCTNAVNIRVEITRTKSFSVTPAGGSFISEDKCLFSMRDQENNAHTYKLPAPKATIFDTDNETLDLTDTDVIALNAAMTTYAKSEGGNPLSDIERGHRTTSRKPIKA